MMPAISVILPVYNAEKYLREAIDSILQQSFVDFELLLINDGSTDGTEQIILSYDDQRLVYIKNETNRGLIYSLNKAIDLAKGEYIARMDADDVAMRERLEKQYAFLKSHPGVAIIASTITFVDDKNREIGIWALDRETVSIDAIKQKMPYECCLAHPSVMGTTNVFRKFKYNVRQMHIEDYDLWLRLLDSGLLIAKIQTPLLNYRLHLNSITHTSNKKLIPQKRIVQCKKIYLKQAIKERRFTFFNLKISIGLLQDLIIILKKRVFG